MISFIIDFCACNCLIVLTLIAVAAIYGWWSMNNIALDAIPDVMKRIGAPLIGGVFTSFLLELLVYPAIYEVWKWHFELARNKSSYELEVPGSAFPAQG